MADTITHLGTMTIGATIPGVTAAVSIGQADLEARIAAIVNWSPGAVSFPDLLALAERILADLQTSIAIGLEPPSIDAQIAVMASVLAGLKAQLRVILAFYDLCAAAGVDAFWYDGSASGMGAALGGEVSGGLPSGGGPLTHANALVLATSVSATATAMGQVFVAP